MAEKNLMQWMLVVDIAILIALSLDVYLSYQTYKTRVSG